MDDISNSPAPDSPQMTVGELARWLMRKPRFAVVSSLRKDGSPWSVPLGFWFDGTHVYLAMNPDNNGVKRFRRDPRVSITVTNDGTFPPQFVTIVGEVEEIEDPGWRIASIIHRRYPKEHVVDEDEYEKTWLAKGKVVFRLSIERRATFDLRKTFGREPDRLLRSAYLEV